jgi:diguanylate cyclase
VDVRYQESTEQSAELLRLILPRIAKNSGIYSPTSYTLWYEYLAGINPRLKEALDIRLQRPEPISGDETVRLFTRHIAAREIESAERLQAEFGALLQRLGSLADSAGNEAADYSRSLGEISAQLDDTIDTEGVRSVIASLAKRTMAAQSSADEMRHQIEDSRREVGALKDQLEKVQGEALTDPLTSLRNRRGFERATATLLAGRPEGLAGCALIMADIDHFKRVNDTYGHLLGDQVIRAIAQILHSNIKGRDIAARLGGEEFAILLPDTDLKAAMTLAEQIRSAVGRGRLRRTGSSEFIDQVTISLGTACGMAHEAVESLLDRADQALYQAKQSGRNRVATAAVAA